VSLKDKALLTDTEIIGVVELVDERHYVSFDKSKQMNTFDVNPLLKAQHDKTVKTILQALSDIKPLGDEGIKEELKKYFTEEQMMMPEEIHEIVCGVIAVVRKVTLEDYNRQMKEMLG